MRLLTAALQTGSFPHAYLFTGPDGVGKQTAAQAFAMACNCQSPRMNFGRGASGDADTAGSSASGTADISCGQCRCCRKILSATHPDVHWILPSGTYIKVDQIRELCQRLALKPYEAKKRVVVIADAHTLNPEAGNTLLKTLEEPPERTVFVLTARQASDLLPTILSRCRHIRFNPVSRESIRNYLKHRFKVDADAADIVAAMAGGSLTRAAAMIEKDWIAHRNWIIRTLTQLDSQPLNYQLAFAESLAKNSSRLETALDIMKSWYRDLAVYPHQPGQLINRDFQADIAARSKKTAPARLLEIAKVIEAAARNMNANANARLAMDHLVLALTDKESTKNGKNNRHPV
ncbi:MAG: DNA polymerase III subunit delta' [Desulfobacterales bacterium]|nr:DNA polymerase III subunit delta' [Desulfobacterales bacterium]